MEALPYLAILLSGLILIMTGNYAYQKARLTRNKRIGWTMVWVGSVMAASILFFFALVSAFGG